MKILCKLPNASKLINGVEFIEHKLGMLSEEISEEVAEHFLKIEGYVRVGPPAKAKAAATTDASATDSSSSDTGATDSGDTAAKESTDAGATDSTKDESKATA